LRVADALYRVGQEALANAVSHGHPSTIVIRVAYEKTRVRVSIEDDGSGFTLSDDLQGFGIRGMRKRAAGISAALTVHSSPGEGTQISVVAPLPARITLMSFLPASLWRQIRNVAGAGKLDPHSYRR
jgi:signal transduction histidine kinase